VKFLVDHQLPPALAEFLHALGHESQHVREVGLKSDDDLTIWKFAVANDFVLVSKDQDFFDLASRPNEKGRLIWLRLGNCRNQPLLQVFEKFLPQILQSFDEGGNIVEIR
jgi:predicted nuclease of predicted toxin-antitoxin system